MKTRMEESGDNFEKKDKKKDKKDKKDKKKKSKYGGWFSSKGNKSKVEIAEQMEAEMLRDDAE